MSLIRRVSVPVAGTVQIIPPDGADHDGRWQWTVKNPTGSTGAVEIVDAPTKAAGAGFPIAAGDPAWQTVTQGDVVYAAGPATGTGPVSLIVAGTLAGD